MNITTVLAEFTSPLTNITTDATKPLWSRGGPFVDPEYFVLPQHTVDLIKKICYLGVCPLLLLAGYVMNGICLVMFTRLVRSSRTSTVSLLLAMAITDILYIVMATFHVLLISTRYYEIPFTTNQRMLAVPYFHGYIQVLPGRIGAWLTMFISFERLFCVIKPIKIRQYSTKKNAIIVIIITYALAITLNLPLMFINQAKEMYSNSTGTYYRIVPSEFGENEELVDIIYLVDEVLFGFIPVLSVTVSCVIIMMVIFVSYGKRIHMTPAMASNQTKERNVTKTLLSLIFLFIICKGPGTILFVIIYINMKPFQYTSNVYEVAIVITYIPRLLKAVVSLIIYYKTSTVYRAHIRNMFGCSSENTNSLMITAKTKNVATACPFKAD